MPTNLTKNQVAIIFLAVILLAGLLFAFFYGRSAKKGPAPVALSMWGTDTKEIMNKVTGAYTAFRPNVVVSYTQVDPSVYKEKLLDALAAGQGPDIFYVGNTWISKEKNKMDAAPDTVFTASRVPLAFPNVVADDFVRGGKVWALPLYIDTLALYWNKDIFDQSGIVYPPADWTQFKNIAARLTTKDPLSMQIKMSGAALGTDSATIANAGDIITTLMEQNGVSMMTSEMGEARFASDSKDGLTAFNYYLSFANPASDAYSWNAGLGDSRTAFATGKTAMIIDYGAAAGALKGKNAFIPLRIAPLPQTGSRAVNTASYEGLAVSHQSTSSAWAWDFVAYATTNAQIMKVYQTDTGKSPALLSLLNEAMSDPLASIFAKQALTAKSWSVPDAQGTADAFDTAISSVFSGRADSGRALQEAQEKINVLIRAVSR